MVALRDRLAGRTATRLEREMNKLQEHGRKGGRGVFRTVSARHKRRGSRRLARVLHQGAPSPGKSVDARASYCSFSKTLHRERIVNDVLIDRGHRLVFLASPCGDDCVFFAKRTPLNVDLVAVNTASIAVPRALRKRLVLHEHTNIKDVLGSLESSHTWLDLTCVDMDMELLYKAIQKTTHKVYLVLNTSRCLHGFAETRARVEVRARFFRARICHEETYIGSGGKRSMILFVLDVSQAITDTEPDSCLGKAVWTKVAKRSVCDNYAYVCEHGQLSYTGRIVDVNYETRQYGIQYYDTHMQLATQVCSGAARVNRIAVRHIVRKPLIEWHDMDEVLSCMGKRRGDS